MKKFVFLAVLLMLSVFTVQDLSALSSRSVAKAKAIVEEARASAEAKAKALAEEARSKPSKPTPPKVPSKKNRISLAKAKTEEARASAEAKAKAEEARASAEAKAKAEEARSKPSKPTPPKRPSRKNRLSLKDTQKAARIFKLAGILRSSISAKTVLLKYLSAIPNMNEKRLATVLKFFNANVANGWGNITGKHYDNLLKILGFFNGIPSSDIIHYMNKKYVVLSNDIINAAGKLDNDGFMIGAALSEMNLNITKKSFRNVKFLRESLEGEITQETLKEFPIYVKAYGGIENIEDGYIRIFAYMVDYADASNQKIIYPWKLLGLQQLSHHVPIDKISKDDVYATFYIVSSTNTDAFTKKALEAVVAIVKKNAPGSMTKKRILQAIAAADGQKGGEINKDTNDSDSKVKQTEKDTEKDNGTGGATPSKSKTRAVKSYSDLTNTEIAGMGSKLRGYSLTRSNENTLAMYLLEDVSKTSQSSKKVKDNLESLKDGFDYEELAGFDEKDDDKFDDLNRESYFEAIKLTLKNSEKLTLDNVRKNIVLD